MTLFIIGLALGFILGFIMPVIIREVVIAVHNRRIFKHIRKGRP